MFFYMLKFVVPNMLSQSDLNKAANEISATSKIFSNRLIQSHTFFKDLWLFISPCNYFTSPNPLTSIKVICTPCCFKGNCFPLEELSFPLFPLMGQKHGSTSM